MSWHRFDMKKEGFSVCVKRDAVLCVTPGLEPVGNDANGSPIYEEDPSAFILVLSNGDRVYVKGNMQDYIDSTGGAVDTRNLTPN